MERDLRVCDVENKDGDSFREGFLCVFAYFELLLQRTLGHSCDKTACDRRDNTFSLFLKRGKTFLSILDLFTSLGVFQCFSVHSMWILRHFRIIRGNASETQ